MKSGHPSNSLQIQMQDEPTNSLTHSKQFRQAAYFLAAGFSGKYEEVVGMCFSDLFAQGLF
jgi:hypothetical protein